MRTDMATPHSVRAYTRVVMDEVMEEMEEDRDDLVDYPTHDVIDLTMSDGEDDDRNIATTGPV